MTDMSECDVREDRDALTNWGHRQRFRSPCGRRRGRQRSWGRQGV